MPNSVNPQSNSLHSQSHTQLTTLSCTTHNISMPHYSPSFLSGSQFESCCGSDRTSCRPSPLSLLSGISIATPYHYIIPTIFSTVYRPPDSTLVSELTYLRPVLIFSRTRLLSCHFSALISFLILVWSSVYF